MNDPVRRFEHSHGSITRLAYEVRDLVRGDAPPDSSIDGRERLVAALDALRDALLEHFAGEEEGLFPFVRRAVPAQAADVERLEEAHDTLCGMIVRLAHLASQGEGPAAARPSVVEAYDRFERAYALHSRDEHALLERLGATLGEADRVALTTMLEGI